MRINAIILIGILCSARAATGQSTSIAKRAPKPPAAMMKQEVDPRNPEARPANLYLERHSLTAVKVKPPRKFKVHDLITIIVREQRKFEADGQLQSKKQFDIKSQLDAIFKPINGTLGAGTFKNGKPNVDFSFNDKLKNESDTDREDKFTTRLTGEIIDVKPNGNIVIQAKSHTTFDEEDSVVTLTGVARIVDVTPDNTVLSTQLSDKVIDVKNEGAVRDGSRRGWIPKALDFLRPF